MAGKTTGKGGNWDTRPNPFANQKTGKGTCELANVPQLGLALDRVCRQGCAVMVGSTRDGGALVLTILDGETRHRTYCSNQDELDAAVESMNFVYSEP